MAHTNLSKKSNISVFKHLIRVSRGLEKADILLKDFKLVNVFTGETLDGINIAISHGLIVLVTKNKSLDKIMGQHTVVIDGKNRLYAVPGFIDAHIHVESTFLNPIEFSKIALLHGTTTVVADPHEIANVCGINCLEWFIRVSENLPIKILIQVPCCVPPTSEDLDNPGAVLSTDVIVDLLKRNDYFGLGELMNYTAIIDGDEKYLNMALEAVMLNKRIYGHIPTSDEVYLNTYALSYASSCHEVTSAVDALEKLRLGYYVMLRTGGAWRNADEILPVLKSMDLSLSRVMLVVDDATVSHLIELGYMDFVVKRAIEIGLDPIEAIQLVTINPAQYLGIDSFVGSIAPGRIADIVVLDDLKNLNIKWVVSNGKIHRENCAHDVSSSYSYSSHDVVKVMNITGLNSWRQLVFNINETKHVTARVIKITPGTPITMEDEAVLPVVNEYVSASPEEDIVHIASIDRYYGGENIGIGFVKGLGLKRGAIAQTIAHDTHNVLAYGADPSDMYVAVKALCEFGGGIVVVLNGKVQAKLELPIAGLMSNKNYVETYNEFRSVADAINDLGFAGDIQSFILTVSVLSLPVIPEIRITPKGLIDVAKKKIIPLIKRASR